MQRVRFTLKIWALGRLAIWGYFQSVMISCTPLFVWSAWCPYFCVVLPGYFLPQSKDSLINDSCRCVEAVDVNGCLCRLNFDKQSEHWTQLINKNICLFCVAESNKWQKNKDHESKRKKGENSRHTKWYKQLTWRNKEHKETEVLTTQDVGQSRDTWGTTHSWNEIRKTIRIKL